jgi:hypothetical protein
MTPEEYILTDRLDELVNILDELELPFHEDLIINELTLSCSTYDDYDIRYRPPKIKGDATYSYVIYKIRKSKLRGHIKIKYITTPSIDINMKGGKNFFDRLRVKAKNFVEKKKKLELLVSKL